MSRFTIQMPHPWVGIVFEKINLNKALSRPSLARRVSVEIGCRQSVIGLGAACAIGVLLRQDQLALTGALQSIELPLVLNPDLVAAAG